MLKRMIMIYLLSFSANTLAETTWVNKTFRFADVSYPKAWVAQVGLENKKYLSLRFISAKDGKFSQEDVVVMLNFFVLSEQAIKEEKEGKFKDSVFKGLIGNLYGIAKDAPINPKVAFASANKIPIAGRDVDGLAFIAKSKGKEAYISFQGAIMAGERNGLFAIIISSATINKQTFNTKMTRNIKTAYEILNRIKLH